MSCINSGDNVSFQYRGSGKGIACVFWNKAKKFRLSCLAEMISHIEDFPGIALQLCRSTVGILEKWLGRFKASQWQTAQEVPTGRPAVMGLSGPRGP